MRDAEFWKTELFREAHRLRRLIENDGAERIVQRPALVEMFVFVTAYEMRKLKDAYALSEEVKGSHWKVIEYPRTVPTPHRTWFRISEDGETWRQPLEQHFDLNAPTRSQLSFKRLCDVLIHHFAFEVRQRPQTGELEILFNSDHTPACLYAMTLDAYVAVVEEVHYDEIRWVEMDQAAERVIQRRHPPPDL